jgi:hypothetical protein
MESSLGEDKKMDKGGRVRVAALMKGMIELWGLARGKNETSRC